MHKERELEVRLASPEGTRRCIRHRVRVTIKIVTDVGETLQGLSNDLCKQGMAFFIPRNFEPGEVVRVEFRLPDSHKSMTVAARVRDCDGFRCGVEFQELGTTDEILLTDCCNTLSALLSGRQSTQLLFPRSWEKRECH